MSLIPFTFAAALDDPWSGAFGDWPLVSPSTHTFHHQMHNLDREMQRMNREMNRAFEQMNRMVPQRLTQQPGRPGGIEEMQMLENPIQTDKDGNRRLNLQFDLKQYKPEEIQIRTKGKQLSVEASHEDKGEHHYVKRSYHRTINLPEGCKPEDLTSDFSKTGVLSVNAPLPRLPPPEPKKEESHRIAIQREPMET